MGTFGSATGPAAGEPAEGSAAACLGTTSGETRGIAGPAEADPGDVPKGAPQDRQNFFPPGTSVPHVAQRTTAGASFGRLAVTLEAPSMAALADAAGADGFASTRTSGEPQFRQKAFAAACSVPQEGHTLRATAEVSGSTPPRSGKGAISEA
jgi:hypothetical protein